MPSYLDSVLVFVEIYVLLLVVARDLEILTLLIDIKQGLTAVQAELQLQRAALKLQQREHRTSSASFDGPSLPLTDMERFEQLEDWLQSPDNKGKMVHLFKI